MEWFWADKGNPFSFGSLSHLIMIFLLFTIAAIMIFSRNSLRNNNNRKIEIFLGITLLTVEWGYYWWLLQTGYWSVSTSLPLELCSITLYTCILFLLTGWKPAGTFLYYAGIAGALQAVLTPVLFIGFPHFRFFHFFYIHMAIILVAIYAVVVKDIVPTFRNAVISFSTLLVLACIIIFINRSTGGNYMFLQRKPSTASLLDVLGPYPYYVFSLSALALGIFLGLAGLYKLLQKGNVHVGEN
ncbi:TIGR02206 family membrane protein [Mangrovibacillus cuniculi]|uniref:TIGR02206 family membrane protein n=1 Tax=Mangrovibacillus cuniculi TaxID=2593652 RepID=A0A7S8HF93_9BACI|nr:TIGR02206 family membrane protein [Mangrovibacillus cuniculi]QPC46522.1 TIGR02206 family membrane protein [Mangrovibacillus cuniculi]